MCLKHTRWDLISLETAENTYFREMAAKTLHPDKLGVDKEGAPAFSLPSSLRRPRFSVKSHGSQFFANLRSKNAFTLRNNNNNLRNELKDGESIFVLRAAYAFWWKEPHLWVTPTVWRCFGAVGRLMCPTHSRLSKTLPTRCSQCVQ
jgi:hypothetical protein